tara:strand:- start:1023 stop:1211 length:189 start_codon:yes stop_codon:yes gene_type:complete
MEKDKMLDLLDRAYRSGCFVEVLRLIRQGTEPKLIEVIIAKAEERAERNPFPWDIDDIFGCD